MYQIQNPYPTSINKLYVFSFIQTFLNEDTLTYTCQLQLYKI